MRAAERRPGPPVRCWTDEHGDWATIGDLDAVRVVPDEDTTRSERATALLAKALANNPVDRDLVTEAYRLLAGLPAPDSGH